MKRVRRLAVAVLLAGLAAAAGQPADSAAQPAAGSLTVAIVAPEAGSPVVGTTDVVVLVGGDEEVRRVTVRVDGRQVAEASSPPWRFALDFGTSGERHRIEVAAEGAGGSLATASRLTAPLVIHDRVETRLRQLYVTVTRGGERQLDLGREDFRIVDDGQEQEIVTFERGDIPFSALLMIDASLSMRGAPLRAALAGAGSFATGMKPLDRSGLTLFSDRLLRSVPFSGDAGELAHGVAGVRATGGTALWDHLYLSYRRVDRQQGRGVIVLLSDGADSHSVLTADDLRPVALRSQALLYWVRRVETVDPAVGRAVTQQVTPGTARQLTPYVMRSPLQPTSWQTSAERRRAWEALGDLVAASGGRTVEINGLEQIEPAFREILDELRQQYALGYSPRPRFGDGRWREVAVEVRGWRRKARTRGGYFDAG